MNIKSQRIVRIAVAAAVLGLGCTAASANCLDFGGFAIFQCADVAYFNPPPVPVAFDPNNRPTNVAGTFWQLGFGNETANNGAGSAGTGNSGLTYFNGNDHGLFSVDLKDARVGTADPTLPAGSICLSSNNWGNFGIDGCVDNVRTTSLLLADDGILNPYYDVHYARDYFAPGYYSLASQQDYPMAILLKTLPDQKFFAVAAAATLNRGNAHNGQNGPCAAVSGTNPAPCDVRPGFYTFKDVANGLPNPISVGAFNVVPWQQVPKPAANCVANCAGSPRSVRFDWTPAVWYHDKSKRPSTNPAMAPADATRAPGVGVLDLLTKADPNNLWRGLVHYDLESATATAANLDPNGRLITASLVFATAVANIPQPAVDPNTGNPTAAIVSTTTSAPPDTCWRVRVKFGKGRETATTSTANCRLGKCGDVGYDIASTDGSTITCVGGALFSEAFTSVSAARSKGSVAVSWTVGAEITMQGYNVYAVNGKGTQTKLNSSLIGCSECTTGVLVSYTQTFPMTLLKGAKGIIVEAINQTPFRSALTPIN